MDINTLFKIKRKESVGYFMIKRLYMSLILWLIMKKTMHGYGVIQEMKKLGFPQFTAARVYPLLSFMQKAGLIKSIKKERRVYYEITGLGRSFLSFVKGWFREGKKGEFFREMVG